MDRFTKMDIMYAIRVQKTRKTSKSTSSAVVRIVPPLPVFLRVWNAYCPSRHHHCHTFYANYEASPKSEEHHYASFRNSIIRSRGVVSDTLLVRFCTFHSLYWGSKKKIRYVGLQNRFSDFLHLSLETGLVLSA